MTPHAWAASQTVTLPLPPSANEYWKKWRGRIVVSNEARAYKMSALVRAKSQGMTVITGDVCLSITVYRPAKRGDLSNRIKVLEDALQGVAFKNDSQVRELHAMQLEDPANPRVVVCVSPWAQATINAKWGRP